MFWSTKRQLRQEVRGLRQRLTTTLRETDRARSQMESITSRLESVQIAVADPHRLRPSFIVSFWATVVGVLTHLSVFAIVRWVFPETRRSYQFVDAWVLMNVILATTSYIVVTPTPLHTWELVILGYGGLRVMEIVIYQMDVLLFGEHRSAKAGVPYALWSSRRTVIHVLHNYVEIIVWFAVLYHGMTTWFEIPLSRVQSLALSFFTMTSFGSSEARPSVAIAEEVLLAHSAIGLFAALLMVARFLALLPAPRMMSDFE